MVYVFDSRNVRQQSISYTYDLLDRLVLMRTDVDGNGTNDRAAFHVHDGLAKHDGHGHALYDVVATYEMVFAGGTITGHVGRLYLHGPGIDEILAEETLTSSGVSSEVHWTLGDHQGTVRDRIIVDGSGVSQHATHVIFDAFGNIVAEFDKQTMTWLTAASIKSLRNPAGPRYGYTGRTYDADLGLWYYRARWYDSRTGRFTSEDPIFADTANTYRYVGNNAVNFTDPSGFEFGDYQWHHLLPREVFSDTRLAEHGLRGAIDIDQKQWGWIMPRHLHTGQGMGIHPQWNEQWKFWFREHERVGRRVTESMVREQLAQMMDAFNMNRKGFAPLGGYCDWNIAKAVLEGVQAKHGTNAVRKLLAAGRDGASLRIDGNDLIVERHGIRVRSLVIPQSTDSSLNRTSMERPSPNARPHRIRVTQVLSNLPNTLYVLDPYSVVEIPVERGIIASGFGRSAPGAGLGAFAAVAIVTTPGTAYAAEITPLAPLPAPDHPQYFDSRPWVLNELAQAGPDHYRVQRCQQWLIDFETNLTAYAREAAEYERRRHQLDRSLAHERMLQHDQLTRRIDAEIAGRLAGSAVQMIFEDPHSRWAAILYIPPANSLPVPGSQPFDRDVRLLPVNGGPQPVYGPVRPN